MSGTCREDSGAFANVAVVIFFVVGGPYLFEQEKKVSNTVEKYGKRGKTRLINHTKSTYGIYSRSLLTWRIVDSAPNAVCC